MLISKSLTIVGAGASTTSVTGGVQLSGSFTGLTLDGLTLSGDAVGGTDDGAVIDASGATGALTDITIQNSVLDGASDGKYAFYGSNIAGTWTWDNNEIKNFSSWYVIDNTSSSFLPPQALSSVVFTDNNVHDVSGSIAFRGKVDDPMTSAVITGNTMNSWVDNSGGGGWIWAGLEISGGLTAVEVANNTITGIPAQGTLGDGHALQLWSLTPWSVDIHDNTLTNNTAGVYIATGSVNVATAFPTEQFQLPTGSIRDNDLSGNSLFGVSVNDLNKLNSLGGITHLSMTSTAIGATDTVNAEYNWWGDRSGPTHSGNLSGTGVASSDYVDYDVWYANSASTEIASATPSSTTYVNGSWSGSAFESDPDGIGPATRFGIDAFSTIQTAVNGVADGGTINIADGTYTEAVVIDSKGLTLTGESQAGVIVQATTTTDALANGPSSSNVFSVGYNDATGTAGKDILIQQMTIQNGAYGIRSKAGDTSVLNTTAQHNGWNGQGLPADQAAAAALWASSATNSGGGIRIRNANDITVANNTVFENLRGLRVANSDNVSVYGNTAERNLDSGLYFSSLSYTGTEGVTNSVMYDNISRGNLNNGILSIGGLNNDIYDNTVEDNYNSGVMLWHPSEITVRENTISNNNLHTYNGIGNDGDAYSGVTVYGAVTLGTETFTAKILDNVIDDNKAGRQTSAVAISVEDASPAAGITIQGNTISNYDIGLRVEVEAASVTVSGNSFGDSGDTQVVNEDTTNAVNASGNWWASNDPATVAAVMTGLVDSTPLLDSGTDTDIAAIGFQGDFSSLTVHTLGEQTGSTGRVQEGIDLVTNSTVNVAAGTYAESLSISKSVTIVERALQRPR